MTSSELIDSKKFCAFMDEFVAASPGANDAARVKMLDSAVCWVGGVPVTTQPSPAPMKLVEPVTFMDPNPKPRRGRPPKSITKTSAPSEDTLKDRAALLAEMRAPLTAEETARLVKESKENAAKVRDAQLVGLHERAIPHATHRQAARAMSLSPSAAGSSPPKKMRAHSSSPTK